MTPRSSLRECNEFVICVRLRRVSSTESWIVAPETPVFVQVD